MDSSQDGIRAPGTEGQDANRHTGKLFQAGNICLRGGRQILQALGTASGGLPAGMFFINRLAAGQFAHVGREVGNPPTVES